jgi:hypothetical protein
MNILQLPFAYFFHCLALIQTLTNSDESMDDFNEKVRRALTIMKFIFIGPALLAISIPMNAIVFFYNMYTSSPDADLMVDSKVFSKQSLN